MPFFLNHIVVVAIKLLITAIGTYGLYVILFRILRTIFRKLEKDIALVTLNVSAYPALTVFILLCLKLTFDNFLLVSQTLAGLDKLLLVAIIIAVSYWVYQLFIQVIIYYLKEYAETTEVMWDNVLLPLLEGVIPIIIILISGSTIIHFGLGIDLTGIWLTLGGATFVIGFAVKDILANFFSGIVLLIDTPFQFGDVLRFESESGSKSSLGILQKIGARVTQVYMFESHTEVYIPNSVVESHKITNLSRPIEPVYYSIPIELSPYCDLEAAKKVMKEIIQAHPDTLGNIDNKLKCLDNYYNWEDKYADSFEEKKQNGKARLAAENEVNFKLDEIEQTLEALALTLNFIEKGGLNNEEIETIQLEFQEVLDLIGLVVIEKPEKKNKKFVLPLLNPLQIRTQYSFEESIESDNLINLVREWYKIWLEDPDIVNQDQYLLTQIWERKIDLLKKRIYGLYKKILYPQQEETRLDDYLEELVRWLKERFKQARSKCQEPEIRMARVKQEYGCTHIEFTLNYYVDDIRLEDGERGIRVNSDIHREIMIHLKEACISRQNS